MMLEWIRTARPDDAAIVIATKTDKLKKSELEDNLTMIYNKLELSDADILVPFSVKDDEGKHTFWDMVSLILGEQDDEE